MAYFRWRLGWAASAPLWHPSYSRPPRHLSHGKKIRQLSMVKIDDIGVVLERGNMKIDLLFNACTGDQAWVLMRIRLSS